MVEKETEMMKSEGYLNGLSVSSYISCILVLAFFLSCSFFPLTPPPPLLEIYGLCFPYTQSQDTVLWWTQCFCDMDYFHGSKNLGELKIEVEKSSWLYF